MPNAVVTPTAAAPTTTWRSAAEMMLRIVMHGMMKILHGNENAPDVA